MAEENDKFDDLDNLSWGDIGGDMERNKQLLKSELEDQNIAVTSEFKHRSLAGEIGLDFLHDVPLNLTVEVGMTKIDIAKILQYEIGSVVELDNVVGQHLNIYINDVLVGLGEIIEHDQKYGVKISKLLNEQGRLEALSKKALPNI